MTDPMTDPRMLVFLAGCAILIVWGFYEKAKTRKRQSKSSGESHHPPV